MASPVVAINSVGSVSGMTAPDPIAMLSQRIAALTGQFLTRDEVLTVVGRAFEHQVDVDDDGQLRALVVGLASSAAVGGPSVADDRPVASTRDLAAPPPPAASRSDRLSSPPAPSGVTAITMAVLALLGGVANVVLAAVLIAVGGDYVSDGDTMPGWYHPTIYVVGGCGVVVAALLLAGGVMTLLRKRFGPPIAASGCALCIAVFFTDLAVTLAAAASSGTAGVRGSPIHYLAGLIFPAVTLVLAMLPATKRWSTYRGRPTPHETRLDDHGGGAAGWHKAPPQVSSDGPTPSAKWWLAVCAVGILLVAALVVSVGVVTVNRFRHTQSSSHTTTTAARPDSRQVELDFGDIANAEDIAVDNPGNVYVSVGNPTYGVLKLGHGATVPNRLPLPALRDSSDIERVDPYGVAVDAAGNVYVAYARDNRVLKLAAGTSDAIELPFTGLFRPFGIGADAAGNVYVADSGNNRVLKLAVGTETPIALPFTGLNSPQGVAVDAAGNVYVANLDSRVFKLAAGSSTHTPFTSGYGYQVAVDKAGSVYQIDEYAKRVLRFAAGADTPTPLPFSGLKSPKAVAIDGTGNVYVLDRGGRNRVLELLAN